MRLMQPEPAAALLGLRAMKTVASVAGAPGKSQLALMEAARRVLLHIEADIADPAAGNAPRNLPRASRRADLRHQFVNGLLVHGAGRRRAVA